MFRQPALPQGARRKIFDVGCFDSALHVRVMREADAWNKRCFLRGERARDACGPRGDLAFVLGAYRGYFAASTL